MDVQTVEHLGQLRSVDLRSPHPEGLHPGPFDEVEHLLAALFANGVAEDRTEQPDVLPHRLSGLAANLGPVNIANRIEGAHRCRHGNQYRCRAAARTARAGHRPPEPAGSDYVTRIYTARRVITMDTDHPEATAVAVDDGRITAVGNVEELHAAGDLDDTFADAVIVPGLIDQHLHPILGATTLATEVIAIEDWVLPERTFPAARSAEDYRRRLTEAEQRTKDPGEWLFSWGYHKLWHGPLDRSALDAVSTTRPIAVWQRSCHEWYLNSAAIDTLGLTEEAMAGQGPASDMVDLAAGHWWESGMNLLLPTLAPVFMSPQRVADGLRQLVAYLHANGVTAINEPGIMGRSNRGSSISRSWVPTTRPFCRRSWSTPAARPIPGWLRPTRWPTPRPRSPGQPQAADRTKCGCCPNR